ncbi:MAG: DNA cytosine methyltransferase [Dolichospermum sp.]
MNNPIAWYLKDLESVPKNGLRVMTTFSCGGGSSMGYKLAGCDVIAANDIDSEMAYHYKLNLNPKHYFLCPIKDLIKKQLPDELYQLDILDGSPPCSTFSMAGSREKAWGKKKHFREGQTKQVLDDLFFDYLDLVEHLKPKVAIAENVKGMIQGNAKGYCKLIIDRFREINYRPQLFLINAADCGVPQKRERVFFCAIRDDIDRSKLVLAPKHGWISASEATSDIKNIIDARLSPIHARLFDFIKEGESLSDYYRRMGEKKRSFSEQKIDSQNPSCVLTANPYHFIHWKYPRYLNYAEWKRLGSFPDDYQAKTDKVGKYMIGMSVPPKMMYAVVKAVIEQWF